MKPCVMVAEFRDEESFPHKLTCRLDGDHAGDHAPERWAAKMIEEPERLSWTATEPDTVLDLRAGPFFVREFDSDGCLVEALEAPTRRDAIDAAYARAATMPRAHWVGWARRRKGSAVIAIRRTDKGDHWSCYYGMVGTGDRWKAVGTVPASWASPAATHQAALARAHGCEGAPSAASGHVERGCDSEARHIELLRAGHGMSKVRSHLTELGDRDVVSSEYGHRDAAFR